MKKSPIPIILLVVAASYSAWLLVRMLQHHQEVLDSVPKQELITETMPGGAEYPQEMWADLSHYTSQIRISRHEQNAIPPNLNWHNGVDAIALGDNRAVKGGTIRLHNVGPFPANFLAFGSPTPQFFHYTLFERIEMPLVDRSYSTGSPVPGLADSWAVTDNTVWFHLNQKAKYSNGRPVRAGDFALGALLRAKSGDAGWERLCRAVKQVMIFGNDTIGVVMRHPTPMSIYLASALLHPAEPGFYAEFGNDYTTRYANRIPPTTGAYEVTQVETGRKIVLEKIRNWWAADIPQRRYVCNVDSIEHHFLTDETQAWELFLRGKLDAIQTRNLAAWDKLEGNAAVDQGRIVRHTFKVDYPLPPYGIAVNTAKLPHITLRRGVMNALDMQHAIDVLFRGQGEQLETFTGGYGWLSPRGTSRYEYNPALAREYFAHAGFTVPGGDGILQRPDGTRLSMKLTYTPSEKTETLFTHLAQSARACGLELVADAEPWQNIERMVNAGEHELLFWAAMPSSLMPHPERFFHSAASGMDAPFKLNEPAMDKALAACFHAKSIAALDAACAEVDELVYKYAIWLPGWKEDTVYMATWDYVHLPLHYEGPYDVMEGHTFWLQR